MVFVLVGNLVPDELLNDDRLAKIEGAIRQAIIAVVPELKPVADEIGFTFIHDPSVKNESKNIPALVIVEGLRDNLERKGNLANEIRMRFKQASLRPERKVQVFIRRPDDYDGESYG